MKYKNFAFLDIETSGTSFRSDHIIEIGILRVENNILVKTFQTLINPQTYVSPFIEEMTGIHKEDLETAPTFLEVKDQIFELLQNCVFVAHNARFDYGFLKREFSFFETAFSMKQLCTVKLSRLLYPQYTHHNLDALISRFGFSCKNRHRAFDDAKVLWDFFQEIQKHFPEEQFEDACLRVMKHTALPIGISQDVLETLPESPGVYLFYGENNLPLYIGKSINIRERVLSHFSNDHRSAKEMKISQQIKHIEIIQTAGELGALFTESRLIKQIQPLYNSQLRNSKKLIKLVEKETDDGYSAVSLETVTTIMANEIESILGVFKSKKTAEEFLFAIAKEHILCHKLLGIEKTKTSCFPYRLGACKGACVQKELPIAYNMRFTLAFSEKRIKRWPFQGPIAIREEDLETKKKELFIIDNWCYLGDGEEESTWEVAYSKKQSLRTTTRTLCANYIFDVDLYTILKRYLLQKGNYKYVKVL